ncbi:hypothetical protein ANN_17007 [Periplaneta americana]|uniref:Uncharacterized protein n=1 Tax=Periplaneta americana TaxID=6978 RepID=A0ABQ8STU2_PERAM|nr:hypothetical protein ANN_17007 [Periplaneta americana]
MRRARCEAGLARRMRRFRKTKALETGGVVCSKPGYVVATTINPRPVKQSPRPQPSSSQAVATATTLVFSSSRHGHNPRLLKQSPRPLASSLKQSPRPLASSLKQSPHRPLLSRHGHNPRLLKQSPRPLATSLKQSPRPLLSRHGHNPRLLKQSPRPLASSLKQSPHGHYSRFLMQSPRPQPSSSQAGATTISIVSQTVSTAITLVSSCSRHGHNPRLLKQAPRPLASSLKQSPRPLLSAHLGQKAWVDITGRLEKPTYYGRKDHDFKIKLKREDNRDVRRGRTRSQEVRPSLWELPIYISQAGRPVSRRHAQLEGKQ